MLYEVITHARDEDARVARDPAAGLGDQVTAEIADGRKAPPFRSAMSMLSFYINRAGSSLDPAQKEILERAKQELRKLYGV